MKTRNNRFTLFEIIGNYGTESTTTGCIESTPFQRADPGVFKRAAPGQSVNYYLYKKPVKISRSFDSLAALIKTSWVMILSVAMCYTIEAVKKIHPGRNEIPAHL